MHYKQNPQCLVEEGTLLPQEVTDELIQQYLGLDYDPYINIKHCAMCPACKTIVQKRGKDNLLVCSKCEGLFCYICN